MHALKKKKGRENRVIETKRANVHRQSGEAASGESTIIKSFRERKQLER